MSRGCHSHSKIRISVWLAFHKEFQMSLGGFVGRGGLGVAGEELVERLGGDAVFENDRLAGERPAAVGVFGLGLRARHRP